MSPYLARLFSHEVPLWHLPATFLAVHLVLYLYLTIFRGSFLAILSLLSLLALAFRLVKPLSQDCTNADWLSEDACKVLYKGLYIGLNKAVGYFRSAVQLKGGFKAVAKAVAFLYLSIAFKFLGDGLALYLGKIFLD
jgi:hypothetical protein